MIGLLEDKGHINASCADEVTQFTGRTGMKDQMNTWIACAKGAQQLGKTIDTQGLCGSDLERPLRFSPYPDRGLSFFCQVEQALSVLQELMPSLREDDLFASQTVEQGNTKFLLVIIYGTAYGAFSPLRVSVMADHVGRRAYGSITAVQGVPVALCAALGPLAAGWLYDTLHHYELAFWLCAAAFLLAALALLLTAQPHDTLQNFSTRSAHMEEDMVGNRRA